MDEYKKGLQQRLVDHEQELRSGRSTTGGSSKYTCTVTTALFCWVIHCVCSKLVLPVHDVPGFRVAAAAVEAEADLRELSIDDWDSALEEAGDTLVVVDFFTNW